MITIRNTTEIREYIHRKIEELDDKIEKYKIKMDMCECFSKQYWLYHDKYQAAIIQSSCLADVLHFVGGTT